MNLTDDQINAIWNGIADKEVVTIFNFARAIAQLVEQQPRAVPLPLVTWWDGAQGPAERLAETLEGYARVRPGAGRDVWAMKAAAKWIRAVLAAPPPPAQAEPIPMVLHCPKCQRQHIDRPEVGLMNWGGEPNSILHRGGDWKNPPHRSHLCHGCGHIWRPADVATVGVEAVKTRGKADSPIATPAQAAGGAGLDDALALGWRSAITAANNICVNISNRHNDDDETAEARAASKCAEEICGYLEADAGYMAEMRALLAAQPQQSATLQSAPCKCTAASSNACPLHRAGGISGARPQQEVGR